MATRVAAFRSVGARERFNALYDRAVVELWPVPSEELDVPTSFGTTRIRRSGTGAGAPLLLLHGNSGTSVGWFTVVGPLAATHEVLAVDVIGTVGRSVQATLIGWQASWGDRRCGNRREDPSAVHRLAGLGHRQDSAPRPQRDARLRAAHDPRRGPA
ncbi:MAG: hypothetical protein WD377_00485 [Nitriliruptoraceae bacterium]